MTSFKTLLIIFFIAISSLSFGQTEILNLPIDSTSNKIKYSNIILLDSLTSKQELFSRATEWFAKTYKFSKDVIQLNDSENGKIVGKANLSVSFTALGIKTTAGYINYTITLYIKNGKYKYEITDFYHVGIYVNSSAGKAPDGGTCENLIKEKKGFWGYSYKRTYENYLIQMDNDIRALVSDLENAMTTKTKNNEW
jgi:hypothetical protein